MICYGLVSWFPVMSQLSYFKDSDKIGPAKPPKAERGV